MVVTGNFKEMGYEDLCWIHVARDQLHKWFCEHSKETSCSAAGRQNIQIFQNDTNMSGFQ